MASIHRSVESRNPFTATSAIIDDVISAIDESTKERDPALVCPIEKKENNAHVLSFDHRIHLRYAIVAAISVWGLVMTGVLVVLIYIAMMQPVWINVAVVCVLFPIIVYIDILITHQILRCFNPMPVLVLSEQNIYSGSEIEVSWMFRGSTRSIYHLKLQLFGTENVSYGHGSSRRTEFSAFYSKVVFETEAPDQIAKGFCMVKIPDESMHSFTSSDNEIRWEIVVRGSTRTRVDVNEIFPIQVLVPLLPS
jgi:hypothetical protein